MPTAGTVDRKAFKASELFDNSGSKMRLSIALVEDDPSDVSLFSILLRRSQLTTFDISQFLSIDLLLEAGSGDYDVIVLDRFIQNVGLSEGRIREVKALFPQAGILMHTSSISPSIRALASQEGAMAVIEKGSLKSCEMELLLITTAALGSKITN